MVATIPRYTVDDLGEFPRDGNRYELLDGMLLVTPAPGFPHQLVVSRIANSLMDAIQRTGHAYVVTPGAISFPPRTQLEPDILVVPSRFGAAAAWEDVGEHWLAVEVYSRSSRIYDHDFKRDNYFRLGVKEVWLVDREQRTVEVSRAAGESEVTRDEITWQPPVACAPVRIALDDIFGALG